MPRNFAGKEPLPVDFPAIWPEIWPPPKARPLSPDHLRGGGAMCGLAGMFSATAAIDAAAMGRAMLALRHRGPDRQSVWISPNRRAGLAHARLALVDLAASGDQPLQSPDRALHLIQNGEFYDFERQRQELQRRGYEFRTGSDAEILLAFYTELGTAALSQLRGEFAFVLWDSAQQRVFAARDRFGIKPLFYAVHGDALYLASEVKALFALGVPAAWDEESVYHYHQTYLLPPGRTLYRGVRQIPPGHFLLASGAEPHQPSLHSYWDFDYPLHKATEAESQAPDEAAQALLGQLETAVQLRLRADVPVASYLSGGLDSCSILALAAKHSTRPVHAFTVSFEEAPLYDETAAARVMAAAVKAEHYEVPVSSAALAEHFPAALWHAEFPFVNANGVAKFLLSRAVHKAGFRAVLTGEGADEILGGYVHFRKDMLLDYGSEDRERALAQLYTENPTARAMMLGAAGEAPAGLKPLTRALGFVPSFLVANATGGSAALALLRTAYRERYAGYDGWSIWLNEVDLPRQLWGRGHLNQALYLWSRTMLPMYLLPVLGDRMEMAHGIEGRLPFLDHHLVEHAARLPTRLKIAPDLTEKLLLREAARSLLPQEVYRRQKQPFLAPPAAAAPHSALHRLMQDTLRSSRLSGHPFYDHKQTVQILDRLPKMSPDEQAGIDCQLTNMLSFVLLGELFGLN